MMQHLKHQLLCLMHIWLSTYSHDDQSLLFKRAEFLGTFAVETNLLPATKNILSYNSRRVVAMFTNMYSKTMLIPNQKLYQQLSYTNKSQSKNQLTCMFINCQRKQGTEKENRQCMLS